MATIDLNALREFVSELVSREGDPEWIIRLGDITEEAPASFTLDIDSGVWFATLQVSVDGDLYYEQIAFDSGRSAACEEYSALSSALLQGHLARIVASQRSSGGRQ